MLPQTLFYIFHIYTRPKFTKPTFTQNQDLHKLKFTQLRFTHTHTNLHSPILAYPNLHNSNLYQTEPKFTKIQIYIVPNCAKCKTE